MTDLFRTDDNAWAAAMDAARYAERRSDIVAKAVGAAAPLIVVAELRRLAAELEQLRIDHRADGWTSTASLGEGLARVRARIAELDPLGGAS